MKTAFCVATIAVVLCGCGERKEPAAVVSAPAVDQPKQQAETKAPPVKTYIAGEGGCSDGAYYLALDKLHPLLQEATSDEATRADVKAARQRISCIREWLPQVSDPCLRVNYESWLDFYVKRADKRQAELDAPPTAKPREEPPWVRMARLSREYQSAHKVQSPPLCERLR